MKLSYTIETKQQTYHGIGSPEDFRLRRAVHGDRSAVVEARVRNNYNVWLKVDPAPFSMEHGTIEAWQEVAGKLRIAVKIARRVMSWHSYRTALKILEDVLEATSWLDGDESEELQTVEPEEPQGLLPAGSNEVEWEGFEGSSFCISHIAYD